MGSNLKISVSCHHFGWAFPSSAKRWGNEGRRIPLKTRFFDFPHRGEAKKQPWDRIYQFRFHTTILGGLLQAVQKAGLTKVVQLRSKRVFSSFPNGAKRKNTLGIEFHEVGFIPPFLVGFCKQRKKPGWRRSSNSVQNSFFRLSPLRRNEESPLESNLPISVSYHHFCRAFASTAKSRVDEGRPIALKTHFFDFPHRCKTKKHPWDRIPRGRFHTTIFGGLLQAAQKAGLTKFVQVENSFFRLSQSGRNEKTPLGSNSTRLVSYHHFGWAFPSSEKRRVDEGRPIAFKTRFSTFAITAKRRITLGIEFTNFGFIPPFLVGFPKHRKKPGWRRSSDCVQNSLIRLSPSGESKKQPWDRIPRGRFHITILVGLLQAVQKARLTKSRQ